MDITWLGKIIPCNDFLMRRTHSLPCPNNGTNVSTIITEDDDQLLPEYLQFYKSYGMKDLLVYMAYGAISSFLMYHVVCGYLQWQYYYKAT